MKEYIDLSDTYVNDIKSDLCDINKLAQKSHPNTDMEKNYDILEPMFVYLSGLM